MKLTADNREGTTTTEPAGPKTPPKSRFATVGRPSHRSSCSCGGRCPRCRAELAAEQASSGLATRGQPLDPQTLGVMESGLGHRLSDVRVHADASAAVDARRRGAEAYAAGRNVVFASGRYQPHTPAGRELLAHELAHVVQQRQASQVVDGVGHPGGTAETQARHAAEQVAAGRRARIPALVRVPGVQLQDEHRFGAGRQQVVVRGQTVTVNGTRIPATVHADGSLHYRGREIVLDGNGIFRRRATGSIVRQCNPEYYTSKGRKRPGVQLPKRRERSTQYYDTRAREYRPWNPPEVRRVQRSGTRPAEPAAPRVDEELATRMREVNRVRSDFETRVQALVDSGVDRKLAQNQVRLQIESGGRPLPGAGELEAGQTYSGSRGPRGEVTITAARQRVATQEFTQVAAKRLNLYLTHLNQRLGTSFGVNPQSLNHAEVRQLVLHPDRSSFYPDRAMCDSCQRIFTLEARARRAELIVVDPDGTARVFTPDGRIVEFREGTVYERRTSVRTTGQGDQRRTRVEIRNDPQVVHRARPRTAGESAGARRSGPTPGSGSPATANTAPNRPPVASNRPPATGNAAPNRPPATRNNAPNRPPTTAGTSPKPKAPAQPPQAPARPAAAAPSPPKAAPSKPAVTPRRPPAVAPARTPPTVRAPTPTVPRGPGTRVGGPRGGRFRGAGAGVALGGVMIVAEIGQLIIDATVVAQLRGVVEDLEKWQAEQLQKQIQKQLEFHRGAFDRRIERLKPQIEARWAAGQPVYLSVRYDILYTDQRDEGDRRTGLFDSTSKPIESLFDLRVHSLENIRIELAEARPQDQTGKIEPALETTLFGGKGPQRTTFFWNHPLLQQPIALGQELQPPPPVPILGPDRVAQVTVSCNEKWIAFHLVDGTVTYELDHCDISLADTYQARVIRGTETATVNGRTIQRPSVTFDLGTADIPEGQSFDFSYLVKEGQENPATFFDGQDSVTLQVVHSVVPFASPEDMFPF